MQNVLEPSKSKEVANYSEGKSAINTRMTLMLGKENIDGGLKNQVRSKYECNNFLKILGVLN